MYLWLKCSWKWKSIQHLALPVHEGNKPFVIITFWFPQHMRVRTICVFICDYKCSKSNIWIKTLHWISSLWQKMILLSNLWLQIGQILTKDRIDLALHQGKKNFKCPQCDEKCWSKTDLSWHIASRQQNSQLFQCDTKVYYQRHTWLGSWGLFVNFYNQNNN